jgi:hypothetical protein
MGQQLVRVTVIRPGARRHCGHEKTSPALVISLSGSEVREASLAKVPRAVHADSADQAASAGNAATVGGQAPGEFAPASRFFQGYATAAPEQTVPIVSRGPFTVQLFCVPSFSMSGPLRAARLQVTVAEPHRTTTTMVTEANESPDQAAGAVHNVGQTVGVLQGDMAFRTVGAYFDVSGGRSLDVSARLRVGHLGAPDCSAHATATFHGL